MQAKCVCISGYNYQERWLEKLLSMLKLAFFIKISR